MLEPQLESHLISQAQQGTLNSNTLGLTPDTVERLYQSASATFTNMVRKGFEPVLLTSPILRFTLFEFLAPILPDINVLSYNDISQEIQFKTFDRLTMQAPERTIPNQNSGTQLQPTTQESELV
jgi:flagellar biosynthesis protein FlhA